MLFEEVYEYVGHMGVYQFCIVVISCLLSMFDIEAVTMVFAGGQMDHWCYIEELTNISHAEQKALAIPRDSDGVYSSCTMYDYNYTLLLLNSTIGSDVTSAAEHIDIIDCNEWVYDKSMFSSTIMSRFDLVCNKEVLTQIVSTLYMLGGLVGAISSGAISDRIGRKTALQVYLSIRIMAVAVFTFAVNYPMVVIGRFFLGVGGSGCRVVAYVLMMEIIGPKYRSVCSCASTFFLSIGIIVCTLVASTVRDDQKYQLAFFAPLLAFLPYVFLLMPESPRWLYSRGRYDDVNAIYRHIATVNNRKLPDDFDSRTWDTIETTAERKHASWTALLQTRRLRIKSAILSLTWFTVSLVYYAMMLNVDTLPGDLYVNTCISGALEIPGTLLGTVVMRHRRLGRRLSAAGLMIATGIFSFICVLFIIFDLSTPTTVSSLLGKMSISAFYAVIIVYTAELFPTEVRNAAMGAGLMCSRTASSITPFMGSNLTDVWKPLPATIMCVFTTVSGLLLFFLPETLGRPLCVTIKEMEEMESKLQRSVAPTFQVTLVTSADLRDVKKAYTNGNVSASNDKNATDKIDTNNNFSNDSATVTNCIAGSIDTDLKMDLREPENSDGIKNNGFLQEF